MCSRCDGKQPCGQCLSSRAPKRCFYDKHRQRVIPSRKYVAHLLDHPSTPSARTDHSRTLEALSQALEECRSVLKRLYPNHEVQALLPLSYQDLLGLLERPLIDTSGSGLPSPPLTASFSGELDSPICPSSTESLCGLEPFPTRDLEWDEERRGGTNTNGIPTKADDGNALSLSVDRQTSYLGASSIKAALMVMLKVQPQLQSALSAPLSTSEIPHDFPAARAKSTGPSDPQRIPWSWKGQTLIDAYFKRVHVFIPMLDETSFRADYLEGQRFDAPWLALLNMVFAMGSIVAMKSDDYNHINYYNRAMEHLPMDAFGSSHIEIVQALALIGGYYLHYTNRPNMANAVLGGTIRMASTLGLHRESLAQGMTDVAAAETRRRTWWSLFCLDTWATTTMGRPSFGRWGPAVSVRAPDFGISAARDSSSQHVGILPLVENIKFCKIATSIQDMLAVAPLLTTEDRHHLDGQLVQWYGNLPWPLRSTDPCAEPLFLARCLMKWRYQNLRMLLHRPVLLSLASSRATAAAGADAAAVETCRALARQTIDDVAREWGRNQMAGGHAAWFLYQAAMVPLVSVFWQWDSPRVPEWHAQIEAVVELLDAMGDWSPAARRSREAVSRMYEASRTIVATTSSEGQQQQQQPPPPTMPSPCLSLHGGFGLLQDLGGLFPDPGAVDGVVVDPMLGMLDHQGLPLALGGADDDDLMGVAAAAAGSSYWGAADEPADHDMDLAGLDVVGAYPPVPDGSGMGGFPGLDYGLGGTTTYPFV